MTTIKSILNISDVFSKIEYGKDGSRPLWVMVSGQQIPLTKNLMALYKIGNFVCSECGCNGTHLQRWLVAHPQKKDKYTEIWRMMTWSNAGQRVSYLNLDHIIPKSMGGTYDADNIRVTCEYCNSHRGNKCTPEILNQIKENWYNNRKFVLEGTKEFLHTHIKNWTKKWTKSYKHFAKLFESPFNKHLRRKTLSPSLLVSIINECLEQIQFDQKINEDFFVARLSKI